MIELELVADNYMVIWEPCRCGGDPECGCWDGKTLTDHIDIGPLLHNLAVAGALTLAWRIGDQHGYGMSDWKPNTEGRAA